MITQLPLDLKLNDAATFANFYHTDSGVVFHLQSIADDPRGEFIFLCGPEGVGKSHLLQAICWKARLQNRAVFYLDTAQFSGTLTAVHPDEMLESVECSDIIAFDGIDVIAQNLTWETALFHAFNRLRDAGKTLLIAGKLPPSLLAFQLPDLKSRLTAGVVYQLIPPNDAGKIKILQWRATQRGLEINNEVAQYIVTHYSRDLTQLVHLLDQLDQVSLMHQRKITIPFLKEFAR